MLLPFSECQKIPYRHGKKNKDKIFEKYNSGLISALLRVKPEKHKEYNKAVHKWFIVLQCENIPISGSMLKEKPPEFTGGLNIEGFQDFE